MIDGPQRLPYRSLSHLIYVFWPLHVAACVTDSRYESFILAALWEGLDGDGIFNQWPHI